MSGLSVSGRRVAIYLESVAIALTLTSLALKTFEILTDAPEGGGVSELARMFNVQLEQSVPTWFSSALLTVAALLMLWIGGVERTDGGRFVRHWLSLGFIFFYLSIDESVGIHERLNDPLRDRLGLDGALYFAWIIVAVPVVLLIGLAYLRFLRALTPSHLRLAVIAFLFYVGGAVGLESIGAWLWASEGGTSNLYGVLGHVEELFEMTGVVVWIAMLLDILASRPVDATLVIRGAGSARRHVR
jgi:hypothetical protein